MITIEQIRPELTWRLRQRVLYPGSKLYEMEMEEDNHGYHFAAFRDNDIIAVVSLFKDDDNWQFRKFAVDPSLQKMGIGKAMLQYITNFAMEGGGARLWCNARDTAIGFYLKHGFKHTGQLFSKNGFNYEILEKHLAHQGNLP
ncbi:phosphoribosylformimino-5-aminoimidazole carboxamide ribotide isomerase [Mucilaginibacter oryzae]|uniref:Phosphoribosylformimino-5-aminoimidazole carboxamide ribotide isomerase n=1 Tax=Mucilaginibacter oryzae TaxID=468058 RepID=A0A316H503_9SPHI|nr:GNAT family N-acetyltransferase [Mucilaginibacter oryzae]PWK74133.1 phosphoribosylformimino-5-aminoimidazole carboxamide ribotide isomerase [Mucilaginibacter oryzae]